MDARFAAKTSFQGSRRKKARRSGLEREHVARSARVLVTERTAESNWRYVSKRASRN